MINLILASSSANRLASWKQGLNSFVSATSIIDRLDTLKEGVERIKPDLLLLDFDLLGLNGSNGAASLKRLSTNTKIIILSGAISEDVEWEMFKMGVRGCCSNDIKPELLKQVVEAVHQGELWIRRTLAGRLIDELGSTTAKNKAYRASLSLLDRLTQREYDIAKRIGKGESNKQIAQACDITERTVKAHLTEIYIKLGITDRLHLALILSADERHARRAETLVKNGY
jgi:DNA-binding NarL/FixJ family response regulator